MDDKKKLQLSGFLLVLLTSLLVGTNYYYIERTNKEFHINLEQTPLCKEFLDDD